MIISISVVLGGNLVVWSGKKIYKRIKKHQLKRNYFKKSKFIHTEEICVICQEDFMLKPLSTELYCGHKYHKNCIRKWVCEKPTCPLCNKGLKHRHDE